MSGKKQPSKHRAIIVGAGRMGSGWGLTERSHYYVHAKTYQDLKDRVELVGFVEPDSIRAKWAKEKWGTEVFPDLPVALEETKANIVSLCVQPDYDLRCALLTECVEAGVEGVWCEKPFALTGRYSPVGMKVQVNYCRRFDRFHGKVKEFLKDSTSSRLVVMAKKDVHTVCHMTDLARWWAVDHFDYVDTPGEPGAYFLRYLVKGKVWAELAFPSGGICGDEFMKVALANLLDAVEGKAELISPPDNAIKSEEWANQILGVTA